MVHHPRLKTVDEIIWTICNTSQLSRFSNFYVYSNLLRPLCARNATSARNFHELRVSEVFYTSLIKNLLEPLGVCHISDRQVCITG